jgi:predicted amidohydrolase
MTIRIAAAQSASIPSNVKENVQIHLKFIEAARQAGVDVLVFPELSLCGYELSCLRECTVALDDVQLAPIQAMAIAASMTVIVGAAVAGTVTALPSIGSIMFSPEGLTSVYRKRYLHPGEEQFVQAGEIDACCHLRNEHVFALAICADTLHEAHAATAAEEGASLYLASVLISEAGYGVDSSILQRYSTNLKMGVLMANHAAPSGGFATAGRSAFWNRDGELVVGADGPGNCLVIADNSAGSWAGRVVAVEV